MSKSAFLECKEREMHGAWVNYFMSYGATRERAESFIKHLDDTNGWDEFLGRMAKVEEGTEVDG